MAIGGTSAVFLLECRHRSTGKARELGGCAEQLDGGRLLTKGFETKDSTVIASTLKSPIPLHIGVFAPQPGIAMAVS